MKKPILTLVLFLITISAVFYLSSCSEQVELIELNDTTEAMIKEDYINFYGLEKDGLTVEDIRMCSLGIYNNAFAGLFSYEGAKYLSGMWWENAGGVLFEYVNSAGVQVWRNHRFYTLTEAFNKKYLKTEDIEIINIEYSKNIYWEFL